jgi:hypothetical protein
MYYVSIHPSQLSMWCHLRCWESPEGAPDRALWVGGRTTRSVIACMLDTVSHIHNFPGECAEGEVGEAKDGDERGEETS